ncbi:MAG: hypothetical protein JSV56_10090 [Methanomassiliicoccales archaeon]|nr:MAG: hypothetical protein JSV56_10090 [Methanomassiliicoccales archaeon]
MLSELGKRMLLIVAKRGYTGADREVFFHHIRGIRYSEMEREVLALESEAYITIEWVGPSNFTVSITPKGVEAARTIEEGIWQKSVEALEKLGKEKHEERSIMHEDIDYSHLIEEKMHVEEVGNLPNEILEKLDEQIMAEREKSYEESSSQGIGIPATREDVEDESLEMEGGIKERRIFGEIESESTGDGESLSVSGNFEEKGPSEGRIAVDKATHVEKRTKEKRISGAIEGGIPSGIPKRGKSAKYNESVIGYEAKKRHSPFQKDLNHGLRSIDNNEKIYEEIGQKENMEADSDTIVISTEMRCLWEKDRLCPMRMNERYGKEITLTPNHCIVCQLVEIKQLLNK